VYRVRPTSQAKGRGFCMSAKSFAFGARRALARSESVFEPPRLKRSLRSDKSAGIS
jgi:hypothetical protein